MYYHVLITLLILLIYFCDTYFTISVTLSSDSYNFSQLSSDSYKFSHLSSDSYNFGHLSSDSYNLGHLSSDSYNLGHLSLVEGRWST